MKSRVIIFYFLILSLLLFTACDSPIKIEMNDLTPISVVITIITAIVGIVAFLIQNKIRRDGIFKDCAKSLYADNLTQQITSAIMLRDYIRKCCYSTQTKNLMVALLRTSIPVTLQKVVADVFSYAWSLNKQDMQCINMVGALIKPTSKVRRLSMREADFFYAIMRDCSINNIDATEAIFQNANLSGTSFHNCVLRSADFQGANVKKVRFDQDCDLEQANFKGAVGLSETQIKLKNKITKEIEIYALIDCLDENGIFHCERPATQYKAENEALPIFISKLGVMDSVQQSHFDVIRNMLQNINDTSLVQIDREHYPKVSQLSDITKHINQCDGCVIFAFEYLNVKKGYIHKNVVGADRQPLNEASVVSPWLHVEAAIACSNEIPIPCLIIYDEKFVRDGMFDEKVIVSDRSMFAVKYTDGLRADNLDVEMWMNAVREHHLLRMKKS